MNKKELKRYINDNGFFMQLDTVEEVTRDSFMTNKKKKYLATDAKIPEGEVLFFHGIASQNYKTGEKNRNGYKYDHSGWKLKNYMSDPLLLLQHDTDEPIGRVTGIGFSENGMELDYFVDPKAIDEKNLHRIKEGYLNGISTGTRPHNFMVEDAKDGKRYTIEAWIKQTDADYTDYASLIEGEREDFVLVITEAELIENSIVTIPSNAGALTTRDSLHSFFSKNMLNKDQFEVKKNTLENQAETPEVETKVETENVETEETPEEPTAEETAETPESSENEAKEHSQEIEALKADNAEMKKQINGMKDSIAAMGKDMLMMNDGLSETKTVIDSLPQKKVLASYAPKQKRKSFSDLLS